MKTYKERGFTKAQTQKIKEIERHISALLRAGVEIHSRQWNLQFFPAANIRQARMKGNDPVENRGQTMYSESIGITDSGADDSFNYPEDIKVCTLESQWSTLGGDK